MGPDWSVIAIVFCGMVSTIAIAFSDRQRKGRAAAEVPAALPQAQRTSGLAGMSFLCGLAAMTLVTGAGIVTACVSMDEITRIPSEVHAHVELASKITLYVSFLPAVLAVAFALAARGAITESRGALRGRSLYRTGVLLSVLSGFLILNGKVLNPASWTSGSIFPLGAAGGAGGAGGVIPAPEEVEGGYLGVEPERADAEGRVRILRVVPGSPAERAGLKAGDRIFEMNGVTLTPGFSLSAQISALKPGTRVLFGLRRGEEAITCTAELAAPFASLLAMLTAQDRDDERLAVLKAAGQDRRYSADELTQICGTFDFDDARLKVIEPALPLLQDLQNAYRILGTLTWADSKRKVSGWIAEQTRSPK